MLDLKEYEQVVAIGMTRTLMGIQFSQVYAYMVGGLLLNTGPPSEGEELVRMLGESDLKLIVNTHYHLDCVGNNAVLQRILSVPIKAHKGSLERIRYPGQEPLLRRLAWGQPLPSKVSKIRKTIKVKDYSFRVVETPGYSPGHICLFESDRKWLFSGDLLAFERNQLADTEEMGKNLKQILCLQPEVVFCGRKGVIEGGVSLVESRLRYLDKQGKPVLSEEVSENDTLSWHGVNNTL